MFGNTQVSAMGSLVGFTVTLICIQVVSMGRH